MREMMKYLFLNQKMNFTNEEFKHYQEQFLKLNVQNMEVAIFPTFTNIPYTEKGKYKIGAQNVSSYKEGSYTGEVSANQLQSIQVEYCLVGHSERRNHFHETDEEIKAKIECLIEEKITPVLCIGELQREERKETLEKQLSAVLDDKNSNIIIAYEPIYSIGTGVVLENFEIEEALTLIKQFLQKNYKKDFPVLYGGSVDDKNIERLNKIPNLDGFLVGKAGLSIEKVETMMEVLK